MNPLAPKLRALAFMMADAAADLDYYGGFDSNARRHAKELAGAARMVKGWARTIARRRPKTAPKKVEDFS